MSSANEFLHRNRQQKIRGLVIAMPQEAKALGLKHCPQFEIIEVGPSVFVCRSGIGQENAKKATQALIAQGVTEIISFGTAVALIPHLKPGDLILPEQIYAQQLDFKGDASRSEWRTVQISYDCDYLIRQSLITLIANDLPIKGGILVNSTEILQHPSQKRILQQKSNAIIADMESFAIAECAYENGIPFVVVRIVVDEANFVFPESVIGAISMMGKIHYGRLFLNIIKNIKELPLLFALMQRFTEAKKTMKKLNKIIYAQKQ